MLMAGNKTTDIERALAWDY